MQTWGCQRVPQVPSEVLILLFLFLPVISNAQSDTSRGWVSASGLFSDRVTQLAVSDSGIFALTKGGVFLSTNDGNSWSMIRTWIPGNMLVGDTVVYSMAVTGEGLLGGTGGEGILLTTDNGATWVHEDSGMPNPNLTIYSLAARDSLVLAGTNDGIFVSSDGGTSWRAPVSLPVGFYVSGYDCFAIGDSVIFAENDFGYTL